MRNACLFLALTILLLLGGITLWLFQAQEPTTVPMVALTPAMPIGTAARAAKGETMAVGAPPAEQAPDLARTAASTPDDLAAIEVLVTSADAGGRLAPRPFVDVQLEVAGSERDQIACTDATGRAHFELARARGLRVVARTSLGGEAAATVQVAAPTQLEVRITARVFVSGTVTDTGGRGIADAELLLLPWATRTGDVAAPLEIGRSGADGSFQVGLAIGGRLGARHGNYGPSPMHLVRLGPAGSPPPSLTLALVLEPTGSRIEGVVVDADGKPVANAELEFRSAAPAPRGTDLAAAPVRVESDQEGGFEAVQLRAGPIDYGVRARGHGTLAGRTQLAAGETARLRLVLPRACTLAGTVVDEAGRAIANARVTAGPPASFVARSTLTDAAGRYLLTELGEGPTPLLAQQQSTSGAMRQAAVVQQLDSDRANEWNATLLPPEATVDLRGTIVDRSDQPLGGWRILARAGSRNLLGTSAPDGTFVIAVPLRTIVDVRAFTPSQALNTFADTVVRGVDPAAGPLRIVGGVAAFGKLRGRVMTHAQQAVPATIAMWHQERAEYVRSTANNSGAFMIDVPAGRLDLTFEHPGHATEARADQTVAPPEPLDLGVITLGAAGILHGSVRGADGSAPAQCQLVIVHQDQRLVADYSGGLYRFAAVPVGEHTLQVQGPGLAAATFPVRIQAGEERQLDLDLRAGVLRRIRIEAPAPGVEQIALALRQPEKSVQWMSAQSGRAGAGQRIAEAEFEAWLPEGSYEAVAWSGNRFEVRATVQVSAASTETVTLRLQPK